MCAGERGARQDIKPERHKKAPPQEKDSKKGKENAPPKRKERRRKPEDARARHYIMVACLVYFAQQPHAGRSKPRPKLPLGLGVDRSIVLSSSGDSA